MALKTNSTVQSTKKKFDFKKSDPIKNNNGAEIVAKNKHIKFENTDETDETVKQTSNKSEKKHIIFDDEDSEVKQSTAPSKADKKRKTAIEIGKQWYLVFEDYNNGGEPIDMKTAEIDELTNLCRRCFESELPSFEKCNPSDVKWLKTALQKGTSKDRANAGALLVQSNPLANLETLETLISFTKITNKNSNDSVEVVTDLFINALLPPNRKLVSFALRGADWKSVKKNEDLDKATKDRIYAYWHIENVIKDQYSDFLRNVQSAIQGNQDPKKKQAIICSSKLLSYAPEKEQMLLSMLVNKLGDPSRVVASKALHHLTDVSHKHPAMCGVITNETEKFLFRNNITEHAQHFALCFLSQLAPHGNVEVCSKLVNICLSFFKIVVNKGNINSKIMQAILLCLKNSITDVIRENATKPGTDCGLLSKDTQDTIYRLVHFANIKISLQTLALLLQIVTSIGDGQQHHRFYNALYKKLLDPELATCGTKFSALFLHIVHRAIHFDKSKSRAQAFIKRLLQVSLYLPAQITCGCLIIINKLVKSRTELNRIEVPTVKPEPAINETTTDNDEKKTIVQSYDPFHRIADAAGAEFSVRTELSALVHHYHPSVRVFAQNIIDNAAIKFYGDPLVDFSLSYFLDRFAFKNPKKDAENKQESVVQSFHHKHYTPHGSRGNSVKQLNNANCTEDERYIFEYLNRKRERQTALGLNKRGENDDEVDDDEFDAYLDSLGGKSKDKDADEDDEFDFVSDLGDEFKNSAKEKKSKDADDENDDWDSEPEQSGDEENEASVGRGANDEDDELGGSDDGSISMDDDMELDDEDEPGSDLFESDDDENIEDDSDPEISDPDDDEPVKSKRFKGMTNKDFQKKLKGTNNMNSLFAAVEDFSEMLDETSKSSKHGTLGEVFNQDKSSEKQLDWESKRLKNSGKFKSNKKHIPKRNRSQGKKRRGESINKNIKKPMAGGKRKRK